MITEPKNVKELIEAYRKRQNSMKSSGDDRPVKKGKMSSKAKMYCISHYYTALSK